MMKVSLRAVHPQSPPPVLMSTRCRRNQASGYNFPEPGLETPIESGIGPPDIRSEIDREGRVVLLRAGRALHAEATLDLFQRAPPFDDTRSLQWRRGRT